ncbi:hypothetical protein PND76_25510 [Klebsiella pneumoniae]|uniref:hypothetical protein n=1 Tax=Klebsiella pneumoniae TaxID=573 RepID=UPI001EC3AF75|nr:hypothetical protein [Klebsiella pneumoniae]EEX2797832.1 hypothetical protein [Escherichia coli]MDB7823418.1 hypothetical protein [Klebsiella pneumoniae]MDB7828580.1 hypothetical protein [Klebsiella pneumoniae]
MNEREKIIFDLVREELADSFIPDSYRYLVDNRFCGHCHHASLAMYCLLGGKDKGYRLQKAVDEKGINHYWLVNSENEIIDPTIEQYIELNRPTPYNRVQDNRASYRKTRATKTIIKNVESKLPKALDKF